MTAAVREEAARLFDRVKEKLLESHAFDAGDFESLRDLPIGQVSRYSWGDLEIEIGKEIPGTPFVMFVGFSGDAWDPASDQVPGDVRIYGFPVPEHRETVEQVMAGQAFVCVKRSTASPSATRTPLTETGFVEAVALEFASLQDRLRGGGSDDDNEDEDDDVEPVQCPDCKSHTIVSVEAEDEPDTPKFCAHCGKALPVEAPAAEGA